MSAPAIASPSPVVQPDGTTARARALAAWRRRLISAAPFACIVIAGLLLLGPGLGHPYIHDWDEAAHQAAARGTFETFFRPHIHDAEVFHEDLETWMEAGVFLHKPTGPFWFAALLMHLIGVTPLALRLASLVGLIAAASAIHLLTRRMVGAVISTAAAVSLLALPFAYQLCQGYMFGDATDCTLLGWVATAMALLVAAIERDDARLAVAAGAATGAAFLCKSALGLTPLGVAFVFAVLGTAKLVKPMRWRLLVAFALAFAVVAVPWNLYCSVAFHAAYKYESATTFDHLFSRRFAQWVRPADAIFNEINETELGPVPPAMALLALVWAMVRAVRKRETVVGALALWVLATWTVLSIAYVKVPATAWGAVAGVLALIAVLFFDCAERPALCGATLGCALTQVALSTWPHLSAVSRALPSFMVQSRSHPQLAVGTLLGTCGAAVGFALGRLLRGRVELRSLGRAAASVLAVLALVPIVRAQSANAAELGKFAPLAPMRELGQALDRALPKPSVVFLQLDHDSRNSFAPQDLMFWSGRNVYRAPPDLAAAAAHGEHPYLVSVAAEPYRPVDVPAFAVARAYDLLAPAPPAPLPEGVKPLSTEVPGAQVFGFASGRRDAEHDIWALYLHANGGFSVPVEFETSSGRVAAILDGRATMANPQRWVGKRWFVVTTLGPPAARVRKLHVGAAEAVLSH